MLYINKYYATILFLFFITGIVYSQCPQNKPSWNEDGVIRLKNSVVRPFYASGNDLETAKKKVEEQKRQERARLIAERVEIKNENANYSSGFDYSAVNLGEEFVLCNGEYHYWQMAQIVVNTGSNPVPEKVDFTERYAFSPRVFIPGMEQLYKGSNTKGVLFIAGEAAFVGGIVVCEGLRSSYESEINSTHNAKDKQMYINNADNMQNFRNGFIAGAALLYAWNVIDGIVAKGKKHIVVLGSNNLKVSPYISPHSNGMMLSFKF